MIFEDPKVPLTIEGCPIPNCSGAVEYSPAVRLAYQIEPDFRSWGCKGMTAKPQGGVHFLATPEDGGQAKEITVATIETIPIEFDRSDGSPGQIQALGLCLAFSPQGTLIPEKSALKLAV